MATARLIPSAYSLSNSSYFSVTNASNAYENVDSTSVATFQTTSSSTSSRYIYLSGFNFNSIPDNANVSAFEIKIKGYESGANTSTNYAPRLTNKTSTISGVNAASQNFSTSSRTITVPTGSLTWAQLKSYGADLQIRVDARRNSRGTASYIYIYGAEINVTYTAETVHPTSVSVDPSSASIEVGETVQLTETVLPSNATDKSVTWSTSASAVATVSNGLVTGVSAGTARITVETNDGGFTDYCDVTVTPAITYDFVQASSMEVGKKYLISVGNSGTIYLLTDESGGSRTLKGVAAMVSGGKLTITGSVRSRAEFDCIRYTSGNDNTITVAKGNQYLYCDNSSGLRMNTPSMLDRFWHYRDYKFWQFKNTTADGYSDTSSEYKYYLTLSSGNYTDGHVTTTSVEESDLPAVYIWEEASDVAPVITVGTPSVLAISSISGHDQCVCTFTSDLALVQWEARATKAGVTPARGVGLLVESGGALAANTNATVYVENEELTNGDGVYTITVYGQSTGGVWSE